MSPGEPGVFFSLFTKSMSASVAAIPEKLFFKIGEVCDIAGVQAHVLRYWETEFPMLQPQKNRAGQRTYRRRDVEMALRIKQLLYDEQYTIAGAIKKLSGELRGPGRENGQATAPKPPGRSLQPPPSLAGRVSQPVALAPPPLSDPLASNAEQHATLGQIAKQLREILDLLNEGDREIEAKRNPL
jgi:DNA-binding transcriptional MerR regulator